MTDLQWSLMSERAFCKLLLAKSSMRLSSDAIRSRFVARRILGSARFEAEAIESTFDAAKAATLGLSFWLTNMWRCYGYHQGYL